MAAMNLSFLPNLITIARILFIVPLVICLLNEDYKNALLIFFLAGLSDGIDGFLAKRFNWKSRFGAILDPIADKLLLVSTMLLLALNKELSWWLFGLVTLRDLVIVIGATVYHKKLGPYEMQPSRLSKANTFFQILLLVSLLVNLGLFILPAWLITILLITVYITTVSSGVHYVVLWGSRFMRNKH